jgi:hypothetical protein
MKLKTHQVVERCSQWYQNNKPDSEAPVVAVAPLLANLHFLCRQQLDRFGKIIGYLEMPRLHSPRIAITPATDSQLQSPTQVALPRLDCIHSIEPSSHLPKQKKKQEFLGGFY